MYITVEPVALKCSKQGKPKKGLEHSSNSTFSNIIVLF